MILVTAPTDYPVSLDELKTHLRLDHSDDDGALAGYLAASVAFIEQWAGVSMLQRTYKSFLDEWPSAVSLPMGPLVSVTHIKTYDDADAATTWDTAEYYVDTVKGRIFPRADYAFPLPERVANGIEIQWVSGHASAGETPENLRHAILLTAGHYYRNREAAGDTVQTTIPLGVEALVNQSRAWLL